MPDANQVRDARAARQVRGAPANDRSAWWAWTGGGMRGRRTDYRYDAATYPLGNVSTTRVSGVLADQTDVANGRALAWRTVFRRRR
jgi:hypothetical protein